MPRRARSADAIGGEKPTTLKSGGPGSQQPDMTGATISMPNESEHASAGYPPPPHGGGSHRFGRAGGNPRPGPDAVPTPDGRLRSEGEQDLDRSLLVASHLWPFIGALTATLPIIWIGVLVFWAVRKDRSPLVDDQGREIINTLLTFCVLALSMITIIGIPIFLVWFVAWLVACVRGAIAAGRSEYFRYPMTIRFIS
jgi:uncharacterized Tic20 family protein